MKIKEIHSDKFLFIMSSLKIFKIFKFYNIFQSSYVYVMCYYEILWFTKILKKKICVF